MTGPEPPGDPQGPDDEEADPDALDDVETSLTRLARRSRWFVAAVLVVALAVPAGGWLVDELAFRGSGAAVEDELGDAEFLADAVLLVRAVDCAGSVATGSAFAVEVAGEVVVVTNRHVVQGARRIGLRALDGGAAGGVAGHRVSNVADVAVLELQEPSQVPPALPVGSAPTPGDVVRTIGFPQGRPSTTTGPVAEATSARLVLDLAVGPGASGSPVLDAQGAVVGQVHARTDDGRGIATPVPALIEAAEGAVPGQGC